MHLDQRVSYAYAQTNHPTDKSIKKHPDAQGEGMHDTEWFVCEAAMA